MEHIKELGIKEHIDKYINVKKLECFTVIVKKGSHRGKIIADGFNKFLMNLTAILGGFINVAAPMSV